MDSAITLKQQVEGINLLLEQIYTPQTKISTILLDCGLTDSDIENIRKNHLQEIVDLALTIFQAFLFARRGGERLWDILCDRYGLLGAEPMTLEKIAKDAESGENAQLNRDHVAQKRREKLVKVIGINFTSFSDRLLLDYITDNDKTRLLEKIMGQRFLAFNPFVEIIWHYPRGSVGVVRCGTWEVQWRH